MLGFFDDADRLVVGVEFHDAIPLGVIHVIAEHRGALLNGGRLAQLAPETIAVEDVVAEHKRARIAVDELLAVVVERLIRDLLFIQDAHGIGLVFFLHTISQRLFA